MYKKEKLCDYLTLNTNDATWVFPPPEDGVGDGTTPYFGGDVFEWDIPNHYFSNQRGPFCTVQAVHLTTDMQNYGYSGSNGAPICFQDYCNVYLENDTPNGFSSTSEWIPDATSGQKVNGRNYAWRQGKTRSACLAQGTKNTNYAMSFDGLKPEILTSARPQKIRIRLEMVGSHSTGTGSGNPYVLDEFQTPQIGTALSQRIITGSSSYVLQMNFSITLKFTYYNAEQGNRDLMNTYTNNLL